MYENDNQYPNDVAYGTGDTRPDQETSSHRQPGYGSVGSDPLHTGADTDAVYGNTDTGRVYGTVDTDSIYGGVDKTSIYGGVDTDEIYGDSKSENSVYRNVRPNENPGYDNLRYPNAGGNAAYSNAQQSSYYTSSAYAGEKPFEAAGNEKKKKAGKGTGRHVLKLVGSGLLFGAVAGAAIVSILYFSPASLTQRTVTEQAVIQVPKADQIEQSKLVETSATVTSAAVVTDVSDVVEEVMPSVVSITGLYKVETPYNPFGGYFGFGMDEDTEEEGSGSGIIVGKNDEELLIVTNNHVVEDSTSLSVQFIDGESVDAQVKGTESGVDLAVISVPLTAIKDSTFSQIKIANLGDSDALKVGEPAIAIGNALGYGQSVTTGVISAVNREYTQDNTTNYLIQTDAAINPGNSGGALINIRGEVVGINSNKIAGSAVEGMGYAIPISTAKPIIEELMTKQTRVKVDEQQKAFLGISGINVTQEVQETYGLPEGIYIAQVHENTAAAKAGLTKGDILVQFDGEKVETLEELTSLLEYYQKGTTVDIVIMQGSPNGYQEKTITVTLGGRTDS